MKDFLLNEKTKELLFKLIKIFKPEFYNKATWFLLVAGVSLVSTKFIEKVISILFEINFDISFTDGNDNLIGLAIIIITLIYHFFSRKMEADSEIKKHLETRTKEREHDIIKFKLLEENLGFQKYNDILTYIITDHSYYRSKFRPIENFLAESKNPASEFITKNIEKHRKTLLKSILDLQSFLVHNFDPILVKNPDDVRYRMLPDLNIDRSTRYPSIEEQKTYDEKSKELDEKVYQAMDDYIKLRRCVKEELYY